MSSFEDTFTKNNKKSDDLQYDDAASYFFFSCIIFTIMVPIVINVWRIYMKKPKFTETNIRPKSKQSFQNMHKAYEEFKKIKYSGFFKCKILIVIVLIYLLIICLGRASLIQNLKTFDPYEILDIPINANKKQIRKAYRKLAKVLHPDNNPGDPEATTKFQLVNKAMRCLTDPEVMEICKKFGNPDGGASFQVGIALPKALLDKENKMLILSLFFIIVLIILPVIVWLWYSEKEKYAEHGVTKESIQQSFYFLKNENLTVNNVLEMCSSSVELKNIFGTKPGQGQHLAKYMSLFEKSAKLSISKERAFYIKPFYMMLAYLNRSKIYKTLEHDMRLIHKKVPALLNAYSELGLQMYAGYCPPGLKPINYNSFMNIYYFSQLYFQGMWMHQSPLFQIPGVTEANIKKVERKMGKGNNLSKILGSEEKIEKICSIIDSSKAEYAKQVLNSLPRMKMQLDFYVDDVLIDETGVPTEDNGELEESTIKTNSNSKEIVRNRVVHKMDYVTIEVNLTDLSIPEDREDAYYFHSQYFPYSKYATWSIFLLNCENKILDYKPVVGNKRVIKEKFKKLITQEGESLIKVLVIPDCYIDLDQSKEIRFIVQKQREKNDFKLHPLDIEACKKPTLFNQLKAQLQDLDSDEELEDEEIEEDEEYEEKIIKENDPDLISKVKVE